MSGQMPRINAVLPVYGRRDITLACLASLARQTRCPDVVIVVDGGSSDGTQAAVKAGFPDVVLLEPPGENWWGGSVAHGIEHVLRTARDDDYILLLNDDTLLPDTYVATVLDVCQAERAAVCGITVDAAETTRILDAGEYIDWKRYLFPIRTDMPGTLLRDDVDFLPGRGTLLPVRMIRRAGNVDARNFPHYLADYDLFARVKKAGFRIGVTGSTWVGCMVDRTGMRGDEGPVSMRDAWRRATARRSMTRIADHLRFVWRHAPTVPRKFALSISITLWHASRLAFAGLRGTRR